MTLPEIITNSNCDRLVHTTRTDEYLRLIQGIDLQGEEDYDCSAGNVWSYRKAGDVRNGISLRLGNMCNGFPFSIAGIQFHNSECAYIAGAYSRNDDDCVHIQRLVSAETNGQKCKRIYRLRKELTAFQREDFYMFNIQWMLWVVWQKCCQNPVFAEILRKIPVDAHIVENTTMHKSANAQFWGAANKELMAGRKRAGDHLENKALFRFKKDLLHARMLAENAINDTGHFTGRNVMGKILKLCNLALIYNQQPPLSIDLLVSSNIHIAGKRLDFSESNSYV